MKGNRHECEKHPDKCSFFHGYCHTHEVAADRYAKMADVNHTTEAPPNVDKSALDVDQNLRRCNSEYDEIVNRRAPYSYTKAEMAEFLEKKSSDLQRKTTECAELEKQRQVSVFDKCKRMVPKPIQDECGEILCGDKKGFGVEGCAKKLCHMQQRDKGCLRYNDHCTLYNKSCQTHHEAAALYAQTRKARRKGPMIIRPPGVSDRIIDAAIELERLK